MYYAVILDYDGWQVFHYDTKVECAHSASMEYIFQYVSECKDNALKIARLLNHRRKY